MVAPPQTDFVFFVTGGVSGAGMKIFPLHGGSGRAPRRSPWEGRFGRSFCVRFLWAVSDGDGCGRPLLASSLRRGGSFEGWLYRIGGVAGDARSCRMLLCRMLRALCARMVKLPILFQRSTCVLIVGSRRWLLRLDKVSALSLKKASASPFKLREVLVLRAGGLLDDDDGGSGSDMVGQGLHRDGKALKLAFEHWIEAIDPRHRSGHNLHYYYDAWCQCQAGEPFFYWLDVGEGRHVDLTECPRTLLKKQCVKYLGPQERELYEYIISQGKVIHKQSREPLDTSLGPKGAKWIFVMSTSKRLYAGKKEKGVFQHSSFLAGGATIAAGRLTAENGVIKSMWAYSGHYKPSVENLSNFMNFLEENGVDLKEVEVSSFTREYDDPVANDTQNLTDTINPLQVILPSNTVDGDEGKSAPTNQAKLTYRRTLSGGLHSPRAADVPQKAILERVKSKSESKSYQLGHKVSLKWSTGAGARIGCVKDYPVELRMQALEMVDLSPSASGLTSVSSTAHTYAGATASAMIEEADIV